MNVIAHNLLAANTNRQLGMSTNDKTKSSEKLASGFRINRAADDSAGLQISEKLRWQIRGLERGEKNTQDGISWLQVADSAMGEITDIIQRIRELAIQGSNDTNTISDRAAIDQEIRELRKEINRISIDSEYNTMDIFDNAHVSMAVIGKPNDLQVFNATYDNTTGDVTWGGFIFHGERVAWDQVDPGMVTTDASGKQIFTGGSYTYTNAGGQKFTFSCEPGDTVPKITRSISIGANAGGVVVDGKTMPWSSLVDENDIPLTPSNVHGGVWTLNYQGAQVGFFIKGAETMADIEASINSCNDGEVTYTWQSSYDSEHQETAVDADVVKSLQISNGFAKSLGSSTDIKYTVCADTNGISLKNSDGNTVSGSAKSWADLGISSWDSGSDIQNYITYSYNDNEGTNDTHISFTFKLSDVTSMDSVIDGLDGMEIKGENIKTSYATNLNLPLDSNVVKVTTSSKNPITFLEEKELGRNFDQKTHDNVADSNITYDSSNHTAGLTFGNNVITYKGQTGQIEKDLTSDVNTYLAYALQRKKSAALSGQDPDQITIGPGNLTDLVGSGNITTDGYFKSIVTLKAGMQLSNGGSSSHNKPGQVGSVYPAAYIDFSGLGSSFQLDDLMGLGFNSTCKTCKNHYSIAFVTGASGGTTASGYEYNFKQQGSNYVLQINLDSLKNHGVSSGSDLAKALVEITSIDYDNHYTQYAADGGKLWIYDNRTQSSEARSATFDTMPFMAIDTDEFKLAMQTSDGRQIDVTYTYDYGDIADHIKVSMNQANNGAYVKNSDGTFSAFDPAVHTSVPDSDRYDLNVSYTDDGGNSVADATAAVNDYVDHAMKHMLEKSNIQLDATDYTTMQVKGDENKNVAIRAVFDSKMVESPYENGLHIQNSSNVGDAIVIPRFSMNTVVQHLFTAGTKTYEQAQSTIDNADYALNFINTKRSMYGAYQNRLEHTYQNSTNAEENMQHAESRIRDTDMAQEMVRYSTHSILEQSGQAILAQANESIQKVLNLLQ